MAATILMLSWARWWPWTWWLPARSFIQGHRDGYAGMMAQDIGSDAYMAGYRLGRDKFLGEA